MTYTAGYETTPEDLKLAVFDLVTYYHRNEHKQRMNQGPAAINNPGSTSLRNNSDFPDHIKRVLDMYRSF